VSAETLGNIRQIAMNALDHLPQCSESLQIIRVNLAEKLKGFPYCRVVKMLRLCRGWKVWYGKQKYHIEARRIVSETRETT
jgi:hypothetical protein